MDHPKKVLLFLAAGFEDLEAVTTLSVCRWTEYRSHLSTIEVTITGLHSVVQGRFGTSFTVDQVVDAVDPTAYAALVIPGGFHGCGFGEAYGEPLRSLIKTMYTNGALIATMCVGILPVAEAGILHGKQATTYSFSRSHDNFGKLAEHGAIPVQKPVVSDGRIISCSGPAYSEDVLLLVLAALIGEEQAASIKALRSGLSQTTTS